MDAECVLISGSANPGKGTICWPFTDLICYACSSNIMMYDPIENYVMFTLHAKSNIKSISVAQMLNSHAIYAASANQLYLWVSDKEHKCITGWMKKAIYENDCQIEIIKSFEGNVVLYDIKGNIKLLSFDGSQIVLKSSLNIGSGLLEAIDIFEYNGCIFIATGGHKKQLSILMYSENKIIRKCILQNGEGSIISMSTRVKQNIAQIAAASSDGYIVLWKIENATSTTASAIKSKTCGVLEFSSQAYNVTVESILSAHLGSVSSVLWGNDKLISSSFDSSITIWRHDTKENIWKADASFASSSLKNGYFSALLSPDYSRIIAVSFNGALHMWKKDSEKWNQTPSVSGHYNTVNDIAWAANSKYLISCSSDQTTRVFTEAKENKNHWHEIARPQIHGYDINAITTLPYTRSDSQSAIKIVSAADEKVIRVYHCPTNFIANLNIISKISIRRNINEQLSASKLVEASSIKEVQSQPLGLMNKPINAKEDENFFDPKFDPEKILANKEKSQEIEEQITATVPTEEYLTNISLWPENNKLYGHVYEVICLASHPTEPWVASASKSQKHKFSYIIIWDIEKGAVVCKIFNHNLNVMCLSFSKDGKYLLSAGRDRMIAVYQRTADPSNPYALLFKKEEAHARAVVSCSWGSSGTDFITVSKEKKAPIKLWSIADNVNA